MQKTWHTGNYYTIRHVALISGLTDRTLRTYISMGILNGEKINGLWHFTAKQVEDFLNHPKVRPSILTKNQSVVYDFMSVPSITESRVCVILDLPNTDPKEVAEFFCYTINKGDFQDFRFSFTCTEKTPRTILSGKPSEINKLLHDYFNR